MNQFMVHAKLKKSDENGSRAKKGLLIAKIDLFTTHHCPHILKVVILLSPKYPQQPSVSRWLLALMPRHHNLPL